VLGTWVGGARHARGVSFRALTRSTGESPTPDGEIVARVRAGDPQAFGVLVTRYREQFAQYASALCGDADLAADALQEAFIRAYGSLDRCRDPDNFKGWFFRILTNQCHNVRDRRREHVSLDALAIGERSVDREIDRAAIRDALDGALSALTTGQREAFVLKHMVGLSYAQIAELLDEGVDALKMRVYRARDIVKDHMSEFLES